MKTVSKIGGALLLALLALAAVLAVRTVRVGAGEEAPGPVVPAEEPGIDLAAVERLAGAIRIPTVSRDGEPPPAEELAALHAYLETAFPRVHSALEREVVGGGSLLYTWTPPDAAAGARPPLLLLAHLDTVPVAPGTEGTWTRAPFSGAVTEDAVWGRGTLDDKAAVTASLEAVERLLGDGVDPPRPVILAYGHDEEVGGRRGAARLAGRLAERGVEPWVVLDEGLAVTEGLAPGVERPVAMIGVAEKGYVSVELTARGPGGHSSMPPPETAVDVLAAGLLRLRERPFPGGLDGPAEAMLRSLAPEMPWGRRLAIANLWLLGPLVERQLGATPSGNALLRTTTAPTMLEGAPKENVLPETARAVVNFRIHPRDTPEGVLDHVRRAVDDPRIEAEVYGGFSSAPSPVSPTDGAAWDRLVATVRRVVPGAAVAPGLVLGGTDARHYAPLTDRIYRFLPYTLTPDDLERVHGTDERLRLEDYARMVLFFEELVRGAGLEPPGG